VLGAVVGRSAALVIDEEEGRGLLRSLALEAQEGEDDKVALDSCRQKSPGSFSTASRPGGSISYQQQLASLHHAEYYTAASFISSPSILCSS
jgi:hypothetical protein